MAWFLDVITPVMLLLMAAVFMAIPLNVPVTALERRGVPRIGGTALVFLVLLVVVGGLGWFLIPRLADDLLDLVARLPAYLATLGQRLDSLFGPEVAATFDLERQIIDAIVPTLSGFVARLGRLTLDLLAGLALLLVLLTLVGYILARPRDL
ncbi:MAG: AI-2E family transporter, partial [Chloroflexi bacterium]|nr:AI-2E family transporter [Chloroflexota bacterium]